MTVMTEELGTEYTYKFDPADYPKMCLPVPIGYSPMGLMVKDLVKAPNWLVGGTPGSGKSTFLHGLAISILRGRPVLLVIIDLKRVEFGYLKEHALVITEEHDVYQMLQSANRLMDQRLQLLEEAGLNHFLDYPEELPPVVIMIDELNELKDENAHASLNRISRLGRAAGFSIVTATQRPSASLTKNFGDTKAMFAATMCFFVRDEVNSRILLDNEKAAHMQFNPGRAIYQWDKEIEVQCMHLPMEKARKIATKLPKGGFPDDFKQSPKRLPPR